MKCDRKNCKKEAQEGRMFCSRSCAQSWEQEEPGRYSQCARTGKFDAEVPGEPSAAPSREDSPKENELDSLKYSSAKEPFTVDTEKRSELERRLNTSADRFRPKSEQTKSDGSEQKKTQSITPGGETGMQETERSALPMRVEGAMPATQPGASTGQLPSSERVELLPPNSPNELVEELKNTTIELIQDLRKSREAAPSVIDKRMQTICNAAAMTSKLMRLQLDWQKLRSKHGPAAR